MNTIASVVPIITGIIGILTAMMSLVKAIQAIAQAKSARDEAEAIKAARILTQASREKEYQGLQTRVAVLENVTHEQGKRLDEGNNKFDLFEREMKENNGLLRELIGVLRASGYKVGNNG